MHLLIDNYDSFTFNIVQAMAELGEEVCVFRNDAISVKQAQQLKPVSLIVSPGPGTPDDAGVSTEMIKAFAGKIPILGICLGHQCIVAAFGGNIVRAERLMHGKVSQVYHDARGLFDGVLNPFEATRYHSLIAREESLPEVLEISAYTSAGEVMGVRLKDFPVEGVQFHPESILTKEGVRLFTNFIETTQIVRRAS